MREIAVIAALLVGPSLSQAEVISMEFKFAPYVGDTKQKSVETVPGQARVFINNVLIAEKEVQKESVPVLFDEREIAAPIVLSTVTLGPILRKGKNKIRVEFEPKNLKLAYYA